MMSYYISPPSIFAPPMLLFSLLTLLGALLLPAPLFIDWPLTSLISLNILIDSHSLIFSSTVSFISFNVYLFSNFYMKSDPFLPRFSWLIFLFVTSMLFLIFIPNLSALLIGWDGLGAISFILIIYYSNPKSLSAGMLTALINRLGDALLLIALATLISQHWLTPALWTLSLSTIVLLTTASFTKSAQIPFSPWLPAAMAAPTPISALVHSSTLVTAGIFLLLRLFPALHSPLFSHLCLVSGGITMLMAGMNACMEMDMKKIIALSTLSQLGLMVFSLGLNLPELTFFHLITHALFKALLFICAGQLIHYNSHNQDLRTSSMIRMPLTSSAFIIANLTLCGLPFLAAFYSKDLIISASFTSLNSWLLVLSLAATAFTTTYTTRLILSLLPYGPPLLIKESFSSLLPPVTLTIIAISGGASLNWLLIPTSPTLPLSLKLLPLLLPPLGTLLAILLPFSVNSTMNSSMWGLTPSISSLPLTLFSKSPLMISSIDQGWQELTGAQGALSLSSHLSKFLSALQSLSTPGHALLCLILTIPLLS